MTPIACSTRARTLDFVRFFAPRPHPQRRDWSSSPPHSRQPLIGVASRRGCRRNGKALNLGRSSLPTRRWRGVDSNFWFRARSKYGRGRRLAALPGRIAPPAARRPWPSPLGSLQADYKHPIGREERILMKLIVDAGTDRTANRLSSVMLRDDANLYRRRTALSVRSLSFPVAPVIGGTFACTLPCRVRRARLLTGFNPTRDGLVFSHGPLPTPTPGLALCRRAVRDGLH
jgi:hypothetical protein